MDTLMGALFISLNILYSTSHDIISSLERYYVKLGGETLSDASSMFDLIFSFLDMFWEGWVLLDLYCEL